MLTSLVLVEMPASCSECQQKTEQRIAENEEIERSPEIDAEVFSEESSAVTDGEEAKSKRHKDTD